MSPPATTPESDLLIEYRLSQLERAVTKLVEQNATIIAMEQRHLETREALERAFKAMKEGDERNRRADEALDGRIRVIETEMPTMRLVRGWVIAGMLAVIAASGTVVLDTVRKSYAPQSVATQQPRTG